MEGRTNLLQPMNDGEKIFSSTLGLRLIVIIFYVHILKQKYGHNLHNKNILRKRSLSNPPPSPELDKLLKTMPEGSRQVVEQVTEKN